MVRLHHVSLLTNDIKRLKNFYIRIFGATIAHRFINKSNRKVYGYFLYLSKGTFLEIIQGHKKIKYNENLSLNHFSIITSKQKFNKIYKKIGLTNIKSKKKKRKNRSFYEF